MELMEQGNRLTYLLDEGNFTYQADMLTRLGEIQGGSFASRIRVNDIVTLSTTFDQCVKKVSATTDRVHGIVVGKPEGDLPTSSLTAGNYKPRAAAITNFIPGKLYSLPLAVTNAAISPGDKLVYDISLGAFDKATAGDETTAAQVVAEQAALQNAGGFIECTVIGLITVRA